MHKDIKINWFISNEKINFLDVWVFFKNGKICFNNYQKPFSKFLYLPFNSFHPKSVKVGFIFSELQRYVRTCSFFEDFIFIKDLFWKRLRSRGYPIRFLKPIFGYVNFDDRKNYLKEKQKENENPIVIKLPNNEKFAKLSTKDILKDTDYEYLRKRNIIPRLVLCWTKNKNLGEMVTSSKFDK